jgi:UDPglucose 6-dehydrogenase
MKLGVIGLGKLGLPLAAVLADADFQVIGFDKDVELINKLSTGYKDFSEPQLKELLLKNSSKLGYVRTIKDVVDNCELIFIIVPTPSDKDGFFSNRNLVSVIAEIGKILKQSKETNLVINIVSTVMPGSCENELIPKLEECSGLKVGEEIGFCYSPEFIALGSVIENMKFPDMHLIGSINPKSADVLKDILLQISGDSVPVRKMTLTEAEIVKISINNFITMKISFTNMLAQLSEEYAGVDIDIITQAMGLDSRIGSKYMKAGTSFGGPCFPRDTTALEAELSRYKLRNALPRAVKEINTDNDKKLVDICKTEFPVVRKIGLVGLAYKTGTYVYEESSAYRLNKLFKDIGREVSIWDPLIKKDEINEADLVLEDDLENLLNFSELIIPTIVLPYDYLQRLYAIKKPLIVIDPWRQVSSSKNPLLSIRQFGKKR